MKDIPLTLIVGGLGTVLGMGVYAFMLFDIQVRSANIHTVEVAIKETEQESNRLEEISNLADQTEKDRAKIEEYILPREGEIELLKTVEGFGAITNSEIVIVSVSERTGLEGDAGLFDKVDLSVTVSGDFSEVFHALSLLETLPYPVTITQVRLEMSKGEKKNVWNASALLTVLRQS